MIFFPAAVTWGILLVAKKDAKNGGKGGFLQFMTREWVRQTRIAGKGGRGY